MVIKALFLIVKNVCLDPASPLPNTVQKEVLPEEEVKRKKRGTFSGRPKQNQKPDGCNGED